MRPGAPSAESAGELLGRFHARVADLDPSSLTVTLPGFHDLRRRRAQLEAAVAADPLGRAAAAAEEIGAARAASALVEAAEDLTRSVPRRVAHNDAKLDNVVFRHGRAVCLVDLDTVMPGAWFWDVGDLLRTAGTAAAEDEVPAPAASVDPVLYGAVLTGYRRAVRAGSAQPAELDALALAGAVVTYEQALRFLADWLAGDVYYRTLRPDQNLERARAQLHLLATMPRVAL